MKQSKWYVYLIQSQVDSSIYTGITTDVDRRLKEHNASSKGAKYTKTRRPFILLTSFEAESRSEASKLEYKIKKLTHKQKIKLVETNDISHLKENND